MTLTAPPEALAADANPSSGVLEIRDVSKAFPNVQALDDVSLDVRPGEVLAFLGENGAGKSTLLKILSGDYQPDIGTLTMNGAELRFSNPREARAAGIRVIYQEPEIIPGVDVAENIYAGELPRRGPFIDRAELNRLVEAELVEYGYEKALPRDRMGDELSSAQRQLVEIMRAVKSEMRILALDEPTSSLTEDEVEQLFTLVRRLRSEGVAIIYVSHRLHEIMQIADRVAILRDGKLVLVEQASAMTEDDIVRNMVGRDLGEVFDRHRAASDRVVLEVEDVRSDVHKGVSFDIKAGEIVGFAGLIGAGRSELAKVIFGAMPKTSGSVRIEGQEVHIGQPSDAIKEGIGFAPEDRKREGLVLIRSVLENTTLAIIRRLTRFRIVQRGREREIANDYVERLNVRTPSLDQMVGKLSGGNQQKVVLARWLAAKPKVLILDEPTRGIDVGAKSEIYRLIDALANEGLAIMLISSELTEVLGMSDRIYVMQGGRITGELPGPGTTEEQVLELAMHEDLKASRAAAEAAAAGGENE
jgi:ABC-type sugar transport system ATPase subunit